MESSENSPQTDQSARDYQRWKRRSMIGGLVVAGVTLLAFLPVSRFFSQRSELAERRQQKAELDRSVASLQSEKEELGTRSAIEIRAKELGLIYPGEEAYGVQSGIEAIAVPGVWPFQNLAPLLGTSGEQGK